MIAQQQTYNYFYRNPELRDSIQTLEDFYYSKINENMGKLRDMEEKLENQDVIAAEALANQVLADNIIEQSSKEVLDLRLKHQKEIFSSSDSLDLLMWANSCYHLYGKSVPMAQVLYNSIYNSSTVFDEDCPENLPKSAELFPTGEKELTLELYPNPNNDILFINSDDENIRGAEIIIRDIDGNIIHKGNIHFRKGLDLSRLYLSSGVYIIELMFELEGEMKSQNKKLVYLK